MLDFIRVDRFCFGKVSLRNGAFVVAFLCVLISIGGPYAFRLGGVWSLIETTLTIICVLSSMLCCLGIIKNKASYLEYFVVVWLVDILYCIMALVLVVISWKATVPICVLNIIVYVGCVTYFISVINGYRIQFTNENKDVDEEEMPTVITN